MILASAGGNRVPVIAKLVATASTRPTKLDQPFTRWSIRKLAAFLASTGGGAIRIGREALRCLLGRRGITFQRTKTWKESTDPERDAKLDRIDHVLTNFPDRTFAFDEFGPLGIRPTGGSCWAERGNPDRVAATYHRTHGVTYFHGCYSIGEDTPPGPGRRPCGRPRTRAGTTASSPPPTPSPSWVSAPVMWCHGEKSAGGGDFNA